MNKFSISLIVLSYMYDLENMICVILNGNESSRKRGIEDNSKIIFFISQ